MFLGDFRRSLNSLNSDTGFKWFFKRKFVYFAFVVYLLWDIPDCLSKGLLINPTPLTPPSYNCPLWPEIIIKVLMTSRRALGKLSYRRKDGFTQICPSFSTPAIFW